MKDAVRVVVLLGFVQPQAFLQLLLIVQVRGRCGAATPCSCESLSLQRTDDVIDRSQAVIIAFRLQCGSINVGISIRERPGAQAARGKAERQGSKRGQCQSGTWHLRAS